MRGFLAALFMVLASAVAAVEPDEILDDPVLEARAREISKDIRCVVCQNEPIDSSNAGVARDLRLLIRERLVAGDSDAEVRQYLVDRYGDYVLFRPPFKPATYALWLAPFALLGVGGLVAASAVRRRKGAGPDRLSAEDEAEVAKMMAEYRQDRKDG